MTDGVGSVLAEASADARVCVVATRPATFERCREGFYPAPASYDRTDEPFEFMAFYRTAPVSAVTHVARVVERVDQHRSEPGPLSERDWTATIDPFVDTDAVVVFELGDLEALASPIENDLRGLRGAWYCTVGDLWGAATLSDLTADDDPS
ncbi:hypothetical protein C475_11905 [Halosimplex carlsbadense 2-9-1]|uniref:Uncharacterized protein n=1 Tax=Halosimplex carlsbadense 2-9-1 TaxID=797114 RepID=M0CNU1_9EURY|nr:hypothetical protein [Halosimplex carlsbadense]ELZ24940.1 hypothetical protein C475_11905 [Halosimplex carlsbadense 2-9-1]